MNCNNAIRTLIVKAIGDEFDRQAQFGYTPGADDLKLVIDDCMRETDTYLEAVREKIKCEQENPTDYPTSVSTNLLFGLNATVPTLSQGEVEELVEDHSEAIALTHQRLVTMIKTLWGHNDYMTQICMHMSSESIEWKLAWSICIIMEESNHTSYSSAFFFEQIGQSLVGEMTVVFEALNQLESLTIDLSMAAREILTGPTEKQPWASLKTGVSRDTINALYVATSKALRLLYIPDKADEDDAD